MLHRRALAVAALGAASCLAAGATVAHAEPTGSTPERWHSAGRWILDPQGRVVITHGVNEVQKDAPYAPDAIGFGEDDAAFLQAHGFTSVRLGVIWTAVEPKPGQYDDAYLARIRRTVDILAAHGVSSLLDFHQDMANPKFQGNGWPDWAIYDNGFPNIIKAGFPGNYFLNEALKYTYDNFLNNVKGPDGIGVADHYAKAWQHVAAAFKDAPGVMGYDLYNEPFPGHGYTECLLAWGCPTADGRLSAVEQKAVNAIRAVDGDTTIYYEPQQFFNIGYPTNVRLQGSNLAMSFHDYCTSQATFHNYLGCSGPDANVFKNAENHSKATGSALLLSEFGAITSPDVIRAQSDLADKSRVGWQWWAYTGGDPTTAGPGNEQALVYNPAKPPTGDNVDWAKIDNLAVIHPDRVAGIPASYAYDRDKGVFTMTWSATKVGGATATTDDETTVLVPERLRAKGYHVAATGAKVTSADGDAVVRLHRDAAATTSTVTITVG